jgi:hypothetical protein
MERKKGLSLGTGLEPNICDGIRSKAYVEAGTGIEPILQVLNNGNISC